MQRLDTNRHTRRTTAFGLTGLCLTAMLVLAPATPSIAQDYQVRELVERLNRLERDLGDVQRQFYRSGGTLPPPDGGAPVSGGGLSPTQAASLSVRIDQLEEALRTMTGQMEKTRHDIEQVTVRLNKLIADVDFRLTDIERRTQQQPGQNTAGIAPPTEQTASTGGAVPNTAAPANTPPPSDQPGTLGTLPADQAGNVAAAVPKGVLPAGDEQTRYNFARRLLVQGDFNEAQSAFQEFIAAHSDHELAANAYYWLGESFYIREIYDEAARAFLAGYQNYKTHAKAPDNLFKLGMSLSLNGQAEEACGTFAHLQAEFPNLPAAIMRRLPAERERAKCN